ncbi:MAG: hypothetical protein ACOC6Q_02320 [Patescibacteria group bacterium]
MENEHIVDSKKTVQDTDTDWEDNIMLEWEAPARPFVKRDKRWLSSAAAVLVLVSLVAILLRDFLLLGVVFALFFVIYALFTNPPEKITHRIGEQGIYFGGRFYSWEAISRFWFSTLSDYPVLVFDLEKGVPSRLIMLLSDVDRKELRNNLEKYILYEKTPPKEFLDKPANWVSEKLGLS